MRARVTRADPLRTRRAQVYCDGCISTIEQFHLQWLKYLGKETKEGDEIDQMSGGSKPPSITYNDEVEDMVV